MRRNRSGLLVAAPVGVRLSDGTEVPAPHNAAPRRRNRSDVDRTLLRAHSLRWSRKFGSRRQHGCGAGTSVPADDVRGAGTSVPADDVRGAGTLVPADDVRGAGT